MDVTSMDGPSGGISIAGLKSKKQKVCAGGIAAQMSVQRGSMLHPHPPSCLYHAATDLLSAVYITPESEFTVYITSESEFSRYFKILV